VSSFYQIFRPEQADRDDAFTIAEKRYHERRR